METKSWEERRGRASSRSSPREQCALRGEEWAPREAEVRLRVGVDRRAT